MPLDPMIANPATVKLADPAEQYGNALKNAYLMNQISEARAGREEKNVLREQYAKGVGADGNVDINKVRQGIASTRGELLPAFDKTQAEIAKMRGASAKDDSQAGLNRAKTLASKLASAANLYKGVSTDLSLGQDQMFAAHKAFVADPDIAEWIKSMGKTPDDYLQEALSKQHAAAQSPAAWLHHVTEYAAGPNEAAKQLENKITMMDNGGTTSMLSTNTYDPNAKPKVLGTYQNTESPKAPKTVISIDNKGPGAFATEAGKGSAKEYEALRGTALGAGKAYDAATTTLGLVDEALTGAGADYGERALSVAKKLGLTNKEDDDKLKATQLLQKHLAKNVFDLVAQMKQANVPINRLTNQELTMIEKGAPNISMDAATIKDLMKRAQLDIRDAALKHNRRRIELLNNPATRTGMQVYASSPINIPGVPDAALDYLRKNPDTAHKSAFEKKYNLPSGAAADLLDDGGTSTGGRPFRVGP